MASTGWACWKPYVSPAVWVSRCQMRIGSVAGTVAGAMADPLRYTRWPRNDSM